MTFMTRSSNQALIWIDVSRCMQCFFMFIWLHTIGSQFYNAVSWQHRCTCYKCTHVQFVVLLFFQMKVSKKRKVLWNTFVTALSMNWRKKRNRDGLRLRAKAWHYSCGRLYGNECNICMKQEESFSSQGNS